MPDFLPPGPRGSENLNYMRWMRSDTLKLFSELAANYGELACVQLGPQRVCLVTDPQLIQRILVNDNKLFKKGRFLEMARELLGDGLLTSEGELHRQQRLLIQPMFHRQMIRSYAGIMVDWSLRARERWKDAQELDLAQEMMRLTLGIVGETLFGSNVEQEAAGVGQALETVLDLSIINRPLQILLRKLPSPERQRFQQAKSLLDRTIQNIIDLQRQSEPGAHHNLIGLLMAARDENSGAGMSDKLIRDEALTLFLAGHETTANALSWSWYLLSRSPRVEALFHRELDKVLAGRAPTVDDLPALSYTRQILTEAMRLYPPAWTLGRRVLQDYPIGQFLLPQDSIVVMSQYLVHRNPRFYADPLAFRPERWTPEFKQRLPKFAYFPFSGGQRNCIGEAFAWMEGTLLLACIGQRWRFECLAEPQLQPMVTLRPRKGLKMRVHARSASRHPTLVA